MQAVNDKYRHSLGVPFLFYRDCWLWGLFVPLVQGDGLQEDHERNGAG